MCFSVFLCKPPQNHSSWALEEVKVEVVEDTNIYSKVREAPWGRKAALLWIFAEPLLPPPPLYLWTCSRNFFFQPHIKQAKVPQHFWILVRPPLFLENVQTLAEKVPHKVWI